MLVSAVAQAQSAYPTKTITMLEEDKAAGHVADLELANAYLYLTDDLDQALDFAEAEYDRRPENIDVNKAMALIYNKMGNPDKAARPWW